MVAMTINTTNGASTPLTGTAKGEAAAIRAPVAVVPTPVPEQQQPRPKQIEQVVKEMKQLVETRAPNSLAFSIDDSTGRTIVRITDATTGEMVRQIPSEELLDIARSLDKMQGLLLRQQA